MSRVLFREVSKKFSRRVVAVDRVSFEVREREFFVILGPSGCGKSTLLRLIAGLEQPDEGEIFIGERLVNNLEPKERDIAMVFQNYALYPHMTVFENMAFALRLRQVPKGEIRTRVTEAARILGIEELLQRKPGELSGGQRQRVALGRAIVRNPRVFLFDEPLSNLDAKLRVGMRAELARLHQRLGTTIIYVTHDQIEAMTLGERIAVMKEGRLIQVADPLTLYNRPVNRFVAGFIGSPPMNFFPGIIRSAPLRFVNPFFSLELNADFAGRLQPDQEVLCGIRPESIQIVQSGPVRARVEVIEQLGNEALAYLKIGDGNCVLRTSPEKAPAAGTTVSLIFDPAALHFFDPKTEDRLN
jgi:multiple sugar transport system ATP-binding protein